MNHSHSPPAAAEPQPAAEPARQFAAFVGIDWADKEHAVCVLDAVPDRQQERPRREVLPHTPEAIAAWADALARDFGDRPVAVMVEQSRGALLQALMQYPQLVLFPINPKQAARYRQALVHSGRKDDPTDAECLARFVREHHRQLRAWKPADPSPASWPNSSNCGEKRSNRASRPLSNAKPCSSSTFPWPSTWAMPH